MVRRKYREDRRKIKRTRASSESRLLRKWSVRNPEKSEDRAGRPEREKKNPSLGISLPEKRRRGEKRRDRKKKNLKRPLSEKGYKHEKGRRRE